MIKFFRRIRKRLLAENRFSKYMLYAVGEIILVVIGILIALGINSWNQSRSEIKKESIILNNLVSELEEQSVALDDYLRQETDFRTCGIYAMKWYVDNSGFQNNDTLFANLNTLSTRRTFNPVNTTFNELVSTGNIGLIRDDNLRKRIMKYYDEIERITLISAYNNTNIVDGLYNPVLLEQTVYVHDLLYDSISRQNTMTNILEANTGPYNSKNLEALYSASEKIFADSEKALNLFNLLHLRTQLALGQINRYTELKAEIEKLVADINRELNGMPD